MSSLKRNKSVNNKSDKITPPTTSLKNNIIIKEKNCNCSTPSGSFLYPGRVSNTLPPSSSPQQLSSTSSSTAAAVTKNNNNSSLDQSSIRAVVSTDSIPFADADTPPRGVMTSSRWTSETSTSSDSSSFEATTEETHHAPLATVTNVSGLHFPIDSDDQVTDCCSLNNLLDALENEGDGVSSAFSFSTLLSVSQEDMASGSGACNNSDKLLFHDDDDNNSNKFLNKGHNTLPRSIQQQTRNSIRKTSEHIINNTSNLLIPNNIYYYCPTTSSSNNNNINNGSAVVHNTVTTTNVRSPQNYQQRVTSPTRTTMARPTNYRTSTDNNNTTSTDKDVLVSPVTPVPVGGGGGLVGMAGVVVRPPSPPSPGSMDDVPPPPPQPHYISTLRANSRRGNSPEKERDPLAGLQRFLRAFYRELAARDPPHPPPWAPALPPGALSPALFQPALHLVAPTPTGEAAPLRLDQLMTAVRLEEGALLEAPRRVLIEGAPGSGKTSLSLRLLHAWATRSDPWLSSAITIALLIPLRELRASGAGLAHFLSKSLLPRAALGGGRDAFSRVWRRLSTLEERLLLVLDGDFEEDCTSGEAADLLEGRLFPDARVVITLCPGQRANSLSSCVQRRVLLTGLQLNHVARLTSQYFAGKRVPDGASRFLDALGEDESPLRALAEWPLGWILLCVMFEERGGALPEPDAPLHEIYHALFRTMVIRSLSRRGVATSDSVELPGHCKKLLAEFGKLTLSCLSSGRFVYLETEIRNACRGLEVTELGFLTRGLQFGRGNRRGEVYHIVHPAFSEFLAAYYVSSVVHYSNILRRELVEIPGLLQADTTSLVPRMLLGLLARKGFLVFEQLCPLDVSVRVLFALLHACGPGEANVAAACRLLRGAGAGGAGAAQVVHSSPAELRGWGLVLASPACPLQALELVVQSECVDPESLDTFFSALAENESVRAVRISSLLGHELSADEVTRLARYVTLTLPKARLQTFELVITCVEDSPPDRFQPLVAALSGSLSRGASICPRLSKLVLDLSLSSSQLAQLCSAIEGAPAVSVLHLPHLGCGADGLRALANLMRVRPLLALNLSGSWGALVRENDPPSSGASVGSAASSTDRPSHLLSKQTAILTANNTGSPKAGSYFSLPRSHAYHSLSRGAAATLPRPPGTPTDDKRLSDSALFQKLASIPACDSIEHRTTSGFHAVFEAARDPSVCVRALNVSKCALGAEDAICLGETVRRSRSLAALRLEGASRLAEVLPVLLALHEAPSLQLLDLASPRLVLTDAPTQMLCHALARSPALRLLGLDGWTFRVEEEETVSALAAFLRATGLRDLVMSHCRLQLTCHDGRLARLGKRDDCEVRAELLASLPEFSCSSVAFLRLAGLHVSVNQHVALRGPHLLPFLRGFSRLSELDLGIDRPTANSENTEVIEDKTLVSFFNTLAQNFRSLQTLRLGNWRIKLEDPEKSLRSVGKALRSCSLSHLRVDGITITDSTPNKGPLEYAFLQTAIGNLSLLTWVAMEGVNLLPGQAIALGRVVRDRFAGSTLRLSAQDVPTDAIKSFISAVQEGARAEVTYLGGTGCNLRIQRVIKNPKIRGRLRRFTSLKD